MSINVNLLPWREKYRSSQNRYFLSLLFAAIVSGNILVLLMGQAFNQRIANQELRNAFLTSHINDLDKHLAEIQDLEIRRRQISDRIHLIEELQNNREVAVRIFDQLVYTAPQGVFYKKLDRSGNLLSMNGFGESSDQISNLMRQLEASAWLHSPILDLIQASPEIEFGRNAFNLSVRVGQQAHVVVSAEG